MNLIDIATNYITTFYPIMPYRTGKLRDNAFGTLLLSPYGKNSIGFDFCKKSGLQYGIILNEAPVINYNLNGRTGSYVNRHYGYFDRFFDEFANKLALQLNGELIQGEL